MLLTDIATASLNNMSLLESFHQILSQNFICSAMLENAQGKELRLSVDEFYIQLPSISWQTEQVQKQKDAQHIFIFM